MLKSLRDLVIDCCIVEGYEFVKRYMDEFVSVKEDRVFLVDWVFWWYDRCGFIFCVFVV